MITAFTVNLIAIIEFSSIKVPGCSRIDPKYWLTPMFLRTASATLQTVMFRITKVISMLCVNIYSPLSEVVEQEQPFKDLAEFFDLGSLSSMRLAKSECPDYYWVSRRLPKWWIRSYSLPYPISFSVVWNTLTPVEDKLTHGIFSTPIVAPTETIPDMRASALFSHMFSALTLLCE